MIAKQKLGVVAVGRGFKMQQNVFSYAENEL